MRPNRSTRSSLAALLILATAPAFAQAPATSFVTGELPCLPIGEHAAATALVDPPLGEDESVRVYFRRLSVEVEDFYWVEMTAAEPGNFWAVLPLPESKKLTRKELEGFTGSERTAAWWRAKESSTDRDPNRDLDADVIRERAAVGKGERRDWLLDGEAAALEGWLSRQKYEPAEWFVARVDDEGRVVARSPMKVAEVREDCKAPLTDEQEDVADELRIGDTAGWQEGDVPFHWECEDIAKRIDVDGDEEGQVCPVAIVWWPTAAGLGALGYIVVTDDDPRNPEVSPSRP
jgi:hypothetical protein